MDLTSITDWKEIGIGIAGLIILGYILYTFIKSHVKELEESRKERQESHRVLMNYVESNNHQKTEMIEKHTQAMVVVGEAIKSHTQIIEKLAEKL